MTDNKLFEAVDIPCQHKDLIHDVAYDYFGHRLATASSDQTVKIWDYDQETKKWICTASWKCHFGSVWKVTWAHPEFSQVIATCSFDRTAAIWEEIVGSDQTQGSQSDDSKSHWVKKASLVDSRTSVTDVKFSPRHLGLLLATCSADGTVRIYEALDVMNLGQWSLQHEIQCKLACSCISWNTTLSKIQNPLIAVGCDDTSATSGAKVFVYEFSENVRRWIRVESLVSINESVHDIAWAPNVGRSYQVLAIATNKDLRIISMKLSPEEPASTNRQIADQSSKYNIRLAGSYNDHGSTVWRVCWNVTGTILATSGDDGQVRLWKANYMDDWKCVAVLRGDGQGGHSIPMTPNIFSQEPKFLVQ